jgi:hypothetical protein
MQGAARGAKYDNARLAMPVEMHCTFDRLFSTSDGVLTSPKELTIVNISLRRNLCWMKSNCGTLDQQERAA